MKKLKIEIPAALAKHIRALYAPNGVTHESKAISLIEVGLCAYKYNGIEGSIHIEKDGSFSTSG